MNDSDKLLKSILEFDPLYEADKITGKSYKEDKNTESLGFLMGIEHCRQKDQILRSAGDTTMSMTLANYCQIVREEGFAQVLSIPFVGNDDIPETLQVWWKEVDGILLVFDTYAGRNVNGGSFYYNWKPSGEHHGHVTSSGGYDSSGIWSGSHDCREGLRFHIRQLRNNGSFLVPWTHGQALWLIHYIDQRSIKDNYKQYYKLAQTRFALLPESVRSRILLRM